MDNIETAVLELAKAQEGNYLAINAIADTLKKMNDRYEQEELRKQLEEEEDEKEKAEAEMKAFIASVVKQVVDLNSDQEKSVGGTAWPMGRNPAGEDDEAKVTPRTATHEVQKPIQAQLLREKGMYKDDVVVDDTGDDEIIDEGAAEQPMEEYFPIEENDVRNEDVAYQALLNKYQALAKDMDAIKKSLPSMLKKASEDTLKKTGFREERPNAPRRIENRGNAPKPLGVNAPITKSVGGNEDVIERLSQLSHKTLAEMRQKIAWARESQQSGMGVGGFAAEDFLPPTVLQ